MTNKNEKYYIVSESELAELHRASYAEAYAVAWEGDELINETKAAEAACRARQVVYLGTETNAKDGEYKEFKVWRETEEKIDK